MVWIDRMARRLGGRAEARDTRWIRRTVALGAFAAIAAVLVVKVVARESYFWWIREDGPIESATSIAYFLASLLAWHLAGEFRRAGQRLEAACYVLLGVGFFFVAGEEISWGQRILGIQSPEFMRQHNHQQETNLHNLATSRVIHTAYVLVSAYGAFASFLVPASLRARHGERVARFAPDRFLAPFFLLALAIYAYFEYVSPLLVQQFGASFGWGKRHFLIAKDQEPAELLMSLGFLAFVVVNCLRQARLHPAKPALAATPRRVVVDPR